MSTYVGLYGNVCLILGPMLASQPCLPAFWALTSLHLLSCFLLFFIIYIIFIYVYGGSKRISGTSEVQHIDFQMEINDDLLLSDGQTLAECKNADLTQYVR